MLFTRFLQPVLAILGLGGRLTTDHYVSSDMGLSSVSTLIMGKNAAVLIDPSFFLTDAAECAAWIKKRIGNKELSAVFITHHHPVRILSLSSCKS
jgi:glyoxylase-like metal-dependent hydrolase (beta-lactamase superfamily II)